MSKVGPSNTGSAGNILVFHNRSLRINSRSVDQREIRERGREREKSLGLRKEWVFHQCRKTWVSFICSSLHWAETYWNWWWVVFTSGCAYFPDRELRTLLVLLCEMGEGHCCTCRSFLKHNVVPGGWREAYVKVLLRSLGLQVEGG